MTFRLTLRLSACLALAGGCGDSHSTVGTPALPDAPEAVGLPASPSAAGVASTSTSEPDEGEEPTGMTGASNPEGAPTVVGLEPGAVPGAGEAAGGGGGSTGSGVVVSDYPFCDYGDVPSGTPPIWVDNPTLTPIGINPYGAPSVTIAGGYILLNEGARGPTQVPQATQAAILARINADLKFESAYSFIHLPPWSTGQTESHYMDYLLVDTGLPNDPNAGGDSSYEGRYPNVETTQVAMTDQGQRYDLTHEFNHVLENSYGTVPGQKVSWIQESYNDYLILLTAENANGATPGPIWTRSSIASPSCPSRAAASPSPTGRASMGPRTTSRTSRAFATMTSFRSSSHSG